MWVVFREFCGGEQAYVLRTQFARRKEARLAPNKEARIQLVFQDFLLKPHKRAPPFSIDGR